MRLRKINYVDTTGVVVDNKWLGDDGEDRDVIIKEDCLQMLGNAFNEYDSAKRITFDIQLIC